MKKHILVEDERGKVYSADVQGEKSYIKIGNLLHKDGKTYKIVWVGKSL